MFATDRNLRLYTPLIYAVVERRALRANHTRFRFRQSAPPSSSSYNRAATLALWRSVHGPLLYLPRHHPSYPYKATIVLVMW